MSMKQQSEYTKELEEYQVKLTMAEARKLVSCAKLAQEHYPKLVDDDVLQWALLKLQGVGCGR